jgi:S1-C subfamily serine protease
MFRSHLPLAIVCSAALAHPAIAQSTAEVAHAATPATVTILTMTADGDTIAQGSGFVIQADGVVVTNYHVMRGAGAAEVRFPQGKRYSSVTALAADAEHDLAILKIHAQHLDTLPLAATIPPVGSKVIVIGAPRGLDFTVTEGIVSAKRVLEGHAWIQMSAAISPGSSGGPVLDGHGNVIGVTTAYRTDGQALNFAVPTLYVKQLMARASSPSTLASAFSASDNTRDRDGEETAGVRFPSPSTEANKSWLADEYYAEGRTSARADNGTEWSRPWAGVLLMAAPNTGLLFHEWQDEGDVKRGVVRFVRNAFATDRGRVLIDVHGGWNWRGYFTDDGGMALAADTTIGDVAYTDSVVARPTELDIDVPSGLYQLEWRSRWGERAHSRLEGDLIDWSGRGAVLVVHDSVYVQLFVSNDRGGSTVFAGLGPLTDGEFSLSLRNGSSLNGKIGGGRISATWIDQRNNGNRFEGQLRGTRE